MSGKRNACGVCTARRLARGGVAKTLPSASTCLTVSLSGVPRRRRAMPLGRFNRAGDEAGRREGARAVVDEDEIGSGRGERLEPGKHALLRVAPPIAGLPIAARAAGDEIRERLIVERAVVCVDRDGDGREPPGGRQCLERMGEEGPAGAGQVLFRPLGADPRAPACGDDDQGDRLRLHVVFAPERRVACLERRGGGVNAGRRLNSASGKFKFPVGPEE